ncbi:MAG: diacylglycerol kinase family protein [Myxococcota bacterium]
MKQPYVLVNALAGRIARDPDLLSRLRRLVPAENVRVTHSLQEVEPALRDAAAASIDTLVIVGGDGSVTGSLTPLLRSWPQGELPAVVLAGGGRLSEIARALGARGRPDAVLARIIDAGSAARCVERHVLRIQPAALGTRYGLVLCVGFPARWLAESERTSGRGTAGGLFVTARTFCSALLGGQLSADLFAPVKAEIRLDGEARETGPITGLAAGTVDALGLPIRLLPTTPPQSGCFHLAISQAGPLQLGLASAALGLGLPAPLLAEDEREAQSMELRFADRAAYAVDTDPFPATAALQVELGPRIRFLAS